MNGSFAVINLASAEKINEKGDGTSFQNSRGLSKISILIFFPTFPVVGGEKSVLENEIKLFVESKQGFYDGTYTLINVPRSTCPCHQRFRNRAPLNFPEFKPRNHETEEREGRVSTPLQKSLHYSLFNMSPRQWVSISQWNTLCPD